MKPIYFGKQGFKLKKISIDMQSLGAGHFAMATNRKAFVQELIATYSTVYKIAEGLSV